MPELPEVEVVRMSLEPRLVGRRFRDVKVFAPALREPLDHEALEGLTGLSVESVRRRAKYLLIDTQGGPTLIIHLGMSGRFTVVPDPEPPARHEHLALGLSDGGRLRLVDPRRFGQALVLDREAIPQDRHFVHLGVEPLGDAFDGAHLQTRAGGRRGPVKTFLMDGKVVVGVGNIYASEVLWRSRVHPKRAVNRIGAKTWDSLATSVRFVLARAIEEGGTTLSDFRDGEGNAGYFQVSLAAYGREGEDCVRCGKTIRRLVQANRSTFYCPGCQH